ncbi:bifunctional diguanylate cyclase/phosphodiesterase [Vibrio diabolicus]|uniref:bifunctional diguanylate cyclase/phosphodiesterase n=1 Tax=Vibrio diabolicus TaxID=50719 RepID=UPI003B5B68DD
MAYIRKNAWVGFKIIIIALLFFTLHYLFDAYVNLYRDQFSNQIEHTFAHSNHLESKLEQHELVINIIAQQLLSIEDLRAKEVTKLIDSIVLADESMSAFAIIGRNGDILNHESKTDVPENFNMLTRPETKESFTATLNSPNIVLGHTYFGVQFNEYVWPIRKAIRDTSGHTKFVVSSVIDLRDAFNFKSEGVKSLNDTYVYRGNDLHFQIAPKQLFTLESVYAKPMPESYQRRLSEKEYFPWCRNCTMPNTADYFEFQNGNEVSLIASIYLPQYDLYLNTEVDKAMLTQKFWHTAYGVLTVFFCSVLIIYMLFSKLSKAEEARRSQLTFQAQHDYLTKAKNRFALEVDLGKPKDKKQFFLLIIDLDFFKRFNDDNGLEQGDKLLISLVNRINASLKDIDGTVYRYSGDEFILIIKTKEQIDNLCQEILYEATNASIEHGRGNENLTASIGIASYPKDGEKLEDLKFSANLALLKAKKKKGCYVVFNKDLKNTYMDERRLELHLERSVINNEIYLKYQPQIDRKGKVIGVEALARWNSNVLGEVAPDKFISKAESNGYIFELGEFIINKALLDMRKICQVHRVTLSINISIRQISEDSFFEKIQHAINFVNFDPSLLILEVTESVFSQDLAKIKSTLHQVKNLGVKLSIDDFGTGYSSLYLMKELPLDELKIDKVFVDNIINEDLRSIKLLSQIISMAKVFDFNVVAEGVENKRQIDLLHSLGCDLFQGYYYSKPLDLNKIDFLRHYS